MVCKQRAADVDRSLQQTSSQLIVDGDAAFPVVLVLNLHLTLVMVYLVDVTS